MNVVRYNESYKEEWDAFVRASRNGTFLFEREYMDYHADRFRDHSLLFYNEKKMLMGLLPANESDGVLYSHQGLTYGGLVFSMTTHAVEVMQIINNLTDYLRKHCLKQLIYKNIPAIYHAYPAEEDLYALFQAGAVVINRAISSVIQLSDPLPFNENRRRGVRRALQAGLRFVNTPNFAPFWEILSDNLQQKYNVSPVHSLTEIEALHHSFPHNIHCYEARQNESVLAGVVVYELAHTVHIQYISASDKGRELGALDFLFFHLIEKVFFDKKWFDFGISTECNGQILNEGLIRQKEGFGARAIVYDTYELKV